MTYFSGVLYYLSTCINPLLYNLMSNKFREAFKVYAHYFHTDFIDDKNQINAADSISLSPFVLFYMFFVCFPSMARF